MAPVYISIDPEATGRNIRFLMKQNGYDIDDVRTACGNVSAQAVYKWLSGRSLPSIDNLKILSVIFGTTMEGILVTDENAHVFFLRNFFSFRSFPVFPPPSALYRRAFTIRSSSSSQSDLSE